MNDQRCLALIGNPNTGKTCLFNLLTGARQRTGNWPGVTVERKEGRFKTPAGDRRLVDLPGIYSLDGSHRSPDEQVTRGYLLERRAEALINVVDASRLQRSLYLTVQLREMGLPVIMALNFMDRAEAAGLVPDAERLAELLGCPVLPISARRNRGIDELKQALARPPASKALEVAYAPEVERALADLAPRLAAAPAARHWPVRWLAVELLQGREALFADLDPALRERAAHWRAELERELEEDIDILIADGRYQAARELTTAALRAPVGAAVGLSDRLDRWVLHRYLGLPIFMAVMYVMFLLTINLGGAFVDFFDLLGGALFVDGLGRLLDGLGVPAWLRVLLADGVGGGVQVVMTFIPIIGVLYLFLSFLEDSGYMARAAFVMDRAMRALGLPGKAFVPLIMGFGCNVPAIMAARTLEQPRERILTVLMAPFMSCGARLSVYVLFAAAFFPQGGQNVVFLLYVIGILAAVLTVLLLRRTLLRGQAEDFLLELPAYHMPSLRSILVTTWAKLKGFAVDAGRVIVLMVVVINALGALGTDGSWGKVEMHESLLARTGQVLTPLLSPMGIDEENWPATVGLITGLLAKEVVVGTLDTIYGAEAAGDHEVEAPGGIADQLRAAAASVKENLSALPAQLLDPLGMEQARSDAAGVSAGAFGAMVARFDGQAGAFAYLLFILLYAPCASATAAVRREIGARWMWFAVLWSTGIAYAAATLFYQLATLEQHPGHSLLWVGVVSVSLLAVWTVLARAGARLQMDRA